MSKRKRSEEEEITREIMRKYNLKRNTLLWRIFRTKYIDKDLRVGEEIDLEIPCRKESIATILDPYNENQKIKAKNLEKPHDCNLNVTTEQVAIEYAKSEDSVVINFPLSEILDQNGRIYPDISSMYSNAFIVSMPNGYVKAKVRRVIIDKRPKIHFIDMKSPQEKNFIKLVEKDNIYRIVDVPESDVSIVLGMKSKKASEYPYSYSVWDFNTFKKRYKFERAKSKLI